MRCALFFTLLYAAPLLSLEVHHPFFLTWTNDPRHSITLVYLTTTTTPTTPPPHVSYGEPHKALQHKRVHTSTLSLEEHSLCIHRVDIPLLKSNTIYTLQGPFASEPIQFRTAPSHLRDPFTFVIGGDVYHDAIEHVEHMMHSIAAQNPIFCVLGGDLAYSFANKTQPHERIERWLELLTSYSTHMITQENLVIPLLPILGNHDIQGGYLQTYRQAPFFFEVFPTLGKRGYKTLTFGNYLALHLLDSGHANPVDGAQKLFLEESLSHTQHYPYSIAAYHVGAYPSYRSYTSPRSIAIRKHFVPLFESFALTAAFEHHDHTLKRTHPIKNQTIDPLGVLYLGDGSLGTQPARTPKTPQDLWYLAYSAQAQAVWKVTLTSQQALFEAIDPKQQILDSTTRPPKQTQKLTNALLE